MSPQITNLLLSLSAIILLTHDGLLLQIVADPTVCVSISITSY